MKYLNLLFFGLMILVNYLANALPLNNKTTGQLSAEYPNLFVPAGITFSIWGVIYLLLLVVLLGQWSAQSRVWTTQMSWLFWLSCVLNALWIVVWHYQWTGFSVVVMLALLVVLVLINLELSPLPVVFLKLVFGVYLGWICIATIANVTAWLVSVSWGAWGLSEVFWVIAMIAIGAFISMWAMQVLRNPFLGLAVVWAFAGIIIRQRVDNPLLAWVAFAGMVVVGSLVVMGVTRRYFWG